MAEFKTAEQYVVARCEDLELKLEDTERKYKKELQEMANNYDRVKAELCDAYDLLGMLRDFIRVRYDNYFGNYISFENIYSRENPEAVARLMEYFDMRPDEEDE